jgi:hypothetical protein
MLENKQPFRQDDKDSPDQFIKKMEKTMSKKRKNNYKNIGELENIYDFNTDITETNTKPINTTTNPSLKEFNGSTISNSFKLHSTNISPEFARENRISNNEDSSHIFRSFKEENGSMSMQAPITPSIDNSQTKKMETAKYSGAPLGVEGIRENSRERTSQDGKKKSTSQGFAESRGRSKSAIFGRDEVSYENHPSSCITHSDICLAKRFREMFLGNIKRDLGELSS